MADLITRYSGASMMVRYHELVGRLELPPQRLAELRALLAQLQAGVSWDSISQAPFAEINIGDLTRAQIEGRLRDLLGDEG